MERVYLDTPPVIYVVEQARPFAPRVEARLAAVGVRQVSSELTRMECRVKPLRDWNTALLQDYEDYFTRVIAEVVGLSRAVLDRAAEIRAQYKFKTPDAIQLAAAVLSGCDVFLTNDHRLDPFTGITVEQVQP